MKREEKKGLPFFGIPKLAPYLKPYRMLFFWMVTMGGIGSAMDAVIPLFQQHAIDHFIAEKTMDGIGGFLALYILVMLVQTATNYISAYGACKVELYIGRDLKREAFNHLQTLSFSYFNQNSVGYIHARVMSDTDRIASTLAWGLMEGVWYIAYLLFAVVMMFVLNWHLALCVMVIVPVLVVSGAYFQKKLVFFHRRVREQNSRITGAFNEGITGAKTTKTLVIEDKVEREFDGLTGEMKRMSVRAMHFRSVFMSTTAFAASVALAIVLWRGGIITKNGVMLIGTLSVFMNYAQGMMEPVQWLVQVISSLVNVQVNVERFTKLMETESDVRDTPEVTEKYGDAFHPKKENWEPLRGDIEFRDVTFRYPDGQENILEHFNLKIPAGTTVAIVGETGAGKSTLVKAMVSRFGEKGLRLVQMERTQLDHLPRLLSLLGQEKHYRFVLFLDDLSFDEGEQEYKILKSAIDGSVTSQPENVLLYVTSNRRHLIKETWKDRKDDADDVYRDDHTNESISLSDRFGLILHYGKLSQEEYLDIIAHELSKKGIALSREELRVEAVRWEMEHSGRNGRIAHQFVTWYAGQCFLKKDKCI